MTLLSLIADCIYMCVCLHKDTCYNNTRPRDGMSNIRNKNKLLMGNTFGNN